MPRTMPAVVTPNPQPALPSAPLAAIDMGSNSFRLEIGQLQHGRYRRLQYLKETVRLGGGLDAEGLLTEAAVQRGLDCLRRFAGELSGFAPAQVRAVATQTLREARNRDAFLARAEGALGFPVEVISGREEARLIYAGVSFLQPSSTPRLVVDIGGRSTEMILGNGRQPLAAESFQVGSVSLSMRWFPDGRFTAQRFRDAQVAAGAELEEALAQFAPSRWREALGSSGTAGAVSQVLAGAGITDGTVTPDGLRWCMQRCLEAGSADALRLPTLRDDRRPIIGGGLALLYTLTTHFGIQALLPAKGALRQGVVIDLSERLAAQRGGTARRAAARGSPRGDMRDHSVAELQSRFGVDTAQAARVQQWALRLWQALCAIGEPAAPARNGHASASRAPALPGDEAQRELEWASALHELGLMVSHHDHHRHSAYLLAHADAPGFSQSQQRRMAELLLGQRGGLRKIEPLLANPRFAEQVLALRLAVILCHARVDVRADALRLVRRGRAVTLYFTRAWADRHLRTLHLLRDECEVWARHDSLRPVVQIVAVDA